MEWIPWAFAAFLLLTALYQVSLWWKERLFLRNKLREINGKVQLDEKADLIALKSFLRANIHYDQSKMDAKRPLLRHTAKQILEMNYGFCGENARVAILMHLYGGRKAHRIYLHGKEWGHVALEHKNQNAWFLFDGHYDPGMELTDEMVFEIPSNQIKSYPNIYKENPYLDFSRIKLFQKIAPLKAFAKLRLPSFLVLIFESPNLLKGIFALFLADLILITLLVI